MNDGLEGLNREQIARHLANLLHIGIVEEADHGAFASTIKHHMP